VESSKLGSSAGESLRSNTQMCISQWIALKNRCSCGKQASSLGWKRKCGMFSCCEKVRTANK
jgi:hypothetical protein